MEKRTDRRTFLKSSAAALSAAAIASPLGAQAAGKQRIKVGMIGCGGRCTGAADNILSAGPDVRLVAMAEIFQDRLDESLAYLKKARKDQVEVDKDLQCVGFDAHERVIEASDVVLIACTSKFHPIYAKKALEAGKHVFVEKPHAIDCHGLKILAEAVRIADEKKLCLVSGLQSRYQPEIIETMQKIRDGLIGDVVAVEENFIRGPYRLVKRKEGQSEMEYQFYNWYHFGYLSGDDVIQSLTHNLDRTTWLMRETPPVKAHGIGGRSSSRGEIFGSVFDHHGVTYEYADGVRAYAFCRTQMGCYNEDSSIVLGTKGRANTKRGIIWGENNWRYEGPKANPYEIEHHRLVEAVRHGRQLNNGSYMVRSTQVAIMGQVACYTGQEVTWEKLSKSDFAFEPREADFSTEPPVKLQADGSYPPPAVPGVTKLL